MRFVSLLIAFCFSMNVMASTGTIQELERHMDDFQYALSVEWDQKDQAFYDAQTKNFFDNISKLINEKGLTKEQVLKLVESKIKNKDSFEALKLKVSLLSKNASTEDLVNIVKDASKDFYSQGASWNGHVVFSAAIGVVLLGAIVYSIWWDANHECVAYESQYICRTVDNCFYNGNNNGFHYDVWGNWVQPGYYCTGPSRTICGDENVCTEYVKKD